MKTEMATYMDGWANGDGVCFQSKISGRNVGVIVSAENIKKIADALRYTQHVGHAVWHVNNPKSLLPCASCAKVQS